MQLSKTEAKIVLLLARKKAFGENCLSKSFICRHVRAKRKEVDDALMELSRRGVLMANLGHLKIDFGLFKGIPRATQFTLSDSTSLQLTASL